MKQKDKNLKKVFYKNLMFTFYGNIKVSKKVFRKSFEGF